LDSEVKERVILKRMVLERMVLEERVVLVERRRGPL
jgi:hypothetical protein